MQLVNALISTVMQFLLLAGIPFLLYAAYQKLQHKRSWHEIAKLAGLAACPWRYVVYSLVLSLITIVALVVWSPPLEFFTRKGSAQNQFVGLGFTAATAALVFMHAVIQTALTEEILFRGLIAGSLSRRLPFHWANLAQAVIFLLPHLLILYIMPEAWGLLPLVFVGALIFGWLRIKSGSIIGPWLLHAAGNVTMALSVAIRTAS